MTTFKEISVEDYKKLLDNKQHTYAKTFKNVELLQNFEDRNIKMILMISLIKKMK